MMKALLRIRFRALVGMLLRKLYLVRLVLFFHVGNGLGTGLFAPLQTNPLLADFLHFARDIINVLLGSYSLFCCCKLTNCCNMRIACSIVCQIVFCHVCRIYNRLHCYKERLFHKCKLIVCIIKRFCKLSCGVEKHVKRLEYLAEHGRNTPRERKLSPSLLLGGNTENMPTTVIADAVGMGILDVMVSAGLAASKGEARRLVQQGGVSVNDQKVTDATATLSEADFADGAAIIKKGKKVYHKITLA